MNANLSSALDLTASLCRTFEGLRLKPYLCPAGYPTQGYGTVNKPEGTKVKLSDLPITKEVADSWLLHELQYTYMAGILQASPNLIKYPKALAAITDFAYNLGVPRYRASTLRRMINAENWVGARQELRKWVRGGGKVLAGLEKRRQAEALLLPN